MGFKRTTEGRVFFQGSGGGANDPIPAAPNTQIQILSLLRALNEKLQDTQADRRKMRQDLETYRAMVDNLTNKSRQSEEAYKALESKIRQGGGGSDPRAAKAEQLAQELAKELEETRKLMLDLEDKADKADKGVIMLNTQIGETRKVNEDLAGNYKNLAERLNQTETKQQELGTKLEETFSLHDRLARKIDKAIEDRARFMRKIERIEETVIQTRDALNAKAMVLLTNGGQQGQSETALLDHAASPPLSAPLAPEGAEENSSSPELVANPGGAYVSAIAGAAWWRRRIKLEAVAVGSILIASVLVGWLISEIQKPSFDPLDQTALLETKPAVSPLNSNEEGLKIADFETPAEQNAAAEQATPEPESEWTVKPAQDQFAEDITEPETAPVPTMNPATNDVGAIDLNDQEKLAELLEDNPDALATELNKIEPSNVPKADRIAESELAGNRADDQPVVLTRVNPVDLDDMKPDTRLPEMIKAIEKQAFEGIPAAQHDLAAIYTAGHGGAKQNYERAAFWFEQAAKGGVANAAYNLGVIYHQGLGTKTDIGKAINWYKQAATQGHPEAQYNLGIAYIEGIGVPYDAQMAASHFRSAADAGIMEAAYNLGLIYENGLLGKPEPETALTWYQTAADKGSPEARAALEQLAKTLGIKPDDVKRLVQKAPQGVAKKASSSAGNERRADAVPVPMPPASSPQGQRALLTQIQDYLMQEGLYPGPADGFDGPQTQDAIRTYQAANDLTADGKASTDLLRHMQTVLGTQ